MPKIDIIVVGASAGGVEAVSKLVAALPKNLDAAVFVTLHFPEHATSVLPKILNRPRTLMAKHPEDGEEIQKAHIYVAPPSLHMLVKPGRIRLVRGPKENGSRPAIDPLFRTAAAAYGERVAAVILSGMLDDGVLGANAVKDAGGMLLVQDPEEAIFNDMPNRALAGARADIVAGVNEIASELSLLAGTHSSSDMSLSGGSNGRLDVSELGGAELPTITNDKIPSPYTCPECNGTLFETEQAGQKHFRCRVGHSYTFDTLENAQNINMEGALWEALKAMEENLALCVTMKARAEKNQRPRGTAFFEGKIKVAEQRVALLRSVLNQALAQEPEDISRDRGVH